MRNLIIYRWWSVIEGGGVSLNWLRKILNKTGLGKNRHGSPRLKSNQKESSEDPNKCLTEGENLGKLPQSSNLQLSSQTLGLSVSSPQNNPRRRIRSPSLFHQWENRGIKSPKSDCWWMTELGFKPRKSEFKAQSLLYTPDDTASHLVYLWWISCLITLSTNLGQRNPKR